MLTTQNPFKHKIKEHTRPIFDIFDAYLSRDQAFLSLVGLGLK